MKFINFLNINCLTKCNYSRVFSEQKEKMTYHGCRVWNAGCISLEEIVFLNCNEHVFCGLEVWPSKSMCSPGWVLTSSPCKNTLISYRSKSSPVNEDSGFGNVLESAVIPFQLGRSLSVCPFNKVKTSYQLSNWIWLLQEVHSSHGLQGSLAKAAVTLFGIHLFSRSDRHNDFGPEFLSGDSLSHAFFFSLLK